MGVSKKDPEVRRRELLHDSQLDQALVKLCMESSEEILRSRFGTDMIFEVTLVFFSVFSPLSALFAHCCVPFCTSGL